MAKTLIAARSVPDDGRASSASLPRRRRPHRRRRGSPRSAPGSPREGAEVIDGADRIVMPGFVDTHRHMWAAMLRGCACYGDLGTYFHDVVFTYGANFTPEDTYTSVRFGLAEAIDSGITTMHAWEHNLQTPRARRRGAAGARGVRAARALLLRALQRPRGRQLVRAGHRDDRPRRRAARCASSASPGRRAACTSASPAAAWTTPSRRSGSASSPSRVSTACRSRRTR